MGRFGWLAVALFVACSGGDKDDEETGPTCGGELTCGEGEFCLSYTPSGGTTADAEYSCEPLPDGCNSFDHMCFDDPPCVEDWAAEVCPPDTWSSGCISFGSAQEASCQAGPTTY